MLSMTRYLVESERLIPWVKFIWYFEAENTNVHYKLLLTDSIDIILNLSNSMIYETGSRKIAAPPFHINGLRNEYSYIHQTGAIRVWGISFFSFGLFPFLNKSLKGIQYEIIDLNTLSASLAQKLETAVICDTVQNMVKCIETVLCSELHVNIESSHKLNLICDFINVDNNITIQSFCMERGINIKTFERAVLDCTGYTPKTLRRIRRFQTASNQLIHQNPISLAGITYDNRFSDQAHFTKEFRKFAGAAPLAFQQEKITVKENVKYSYA